MSADLQTNDHNKIKYAHIATWLYGLATAKNGGNSNMLN